MSVLLLGNSAAAESIGSLHPGEQHITICYCILLRITIYYYILLYIDILLHITSTMGKGERGLSFALDTAPGASKILHPRPL